MLLPYRFKKWGWILFLPSLAFGILLLTILNDLERFPLNLNVFAIYGSEILEEPTFFNWMPVNATPTLTAFFILLGSLLLIFSKQKVEDEYVSSMRLNALLWAVLVNQIVLLLFTIFVYGEPYFNVLLYNLFTIPIIFLIRFYYVLAKQKKESNTSS